MNKEIIVASGVKRGEVIIETANGFGAHGYKGNWRKVQESKKGKFVVVDKKRVYIEVPTKGEWVTFDFDGNVSQDGCGISKWVGETITIKY